MEKQILVACGTAWFEFTKSRTGQLDFAGRLDGSAPDVTGWQELAGSGYFSPSYYIYLYDGENMTPRVFVAPGVDVSGRDVYAYLLHVGALLAAVDAKDSLLAGELYLRRKETFESFARLTQYIMEDLSVEILFSLCFGRMSNADEDDVPLVLDSARQKLDFDPSRETLEQAFIRYFKERRCTLTLPLVGTNYYDWEAEPEVLRRLCDKLDASDLLGNAQKIRCAKHDFYAALRTVVQAEPYNPHDQYAILASIEGIESKICGNVGLEKVGHIRATAARVIRLAKPQQMGYEAKLARLSKRDIVVQVTV
jgi:hypothetical protein